MKNIVIKKSKKEGKGVFVLRDFKRGDTILKIYDTKIVSKKDVPNLPKEDQNHTSYIGGGKYIVMKSPEKYINHSCNPNVYIKNMKVIAMKNIKKREEITFDYSINGIDSWKMKCNCGSKDCRKIIVGDFRKLNKKTQKKYLPYLEDWFKKEIKI